MQPTFIKHIIFNTNSKVWILIWITEKGMEDTCYCFTNKNISKSRLKQQNSFELVWWDAFCGGWNCLLKNEVKFCFLRFSREFWRFVFGLNERISTDKRNISKFYWECVGSIEAYNLKNFNYQVEFPHELKQSGISDPKKSFLLLEEQLKIF